MSKKGLLAVFVFVLVCSFPSVAGYADLELAASGFADNHITISVHNPTSTSTSARAQVTVGLDDATSQTLTSPNFTIGGNATMSVTLTAARTIVGIGDDPQPIGPAK